MDPIIITEDFKETIAYFIEKSETTRVDHILRKMVEGGYVDDQFGHLIFAGDSEVSEYNIEIDLVVLDAIEDEIKRQLLVKYNNQN
jgi:hypothetical protein